MKCKSCDAELEEGVTLCPSCGFENEPEEQTAVTETESEALLPDQPTEDHSGDVERISEEIEEKLTESEEDSEASEQNTESSAEEPSTQIVEGKLTGGKIALLVVLAVAAVAVVAALIVGGFKGSDDPSAPSEPSTTAPVETTEATIPEDGNPDDVTCKGTYTVTDDELQSQLDAVVATLGDEKLTNGQLQIYYWMQVYDFMEKYGQYAAAFGMDITQPLDMQKSMDPELTWQQFFLREALNSWKNYKALSLKAGAEDFAMDEEFAKHLQELPTNLEAAAQKGGYESVEAMIRSDMGPGATFENYLEYMNNYYTGFLYYGSKMDQIQVTDDQVEAYFNEHEQEYAEKGLKKDDGKVVDVRHILLKPEGGTKGEDGNVTYSDEEWAACEEAAQTLLDEFLAGEQTQEHFAEMATEHSQDPGSASKGGLYTDVYKGQMVAPFEEWSFDDSRAAGDTGLVKTEYGYHVMYYVGSRLVWQTTAKQDLLVEKGNEFLNGVVAEFPAEVDYSAIALGFVNLGKQ